MTPVAQACRSEVAPHAAPVATCRVVILRVLVWVPDPQVTSHDPQADQVPITQSTAEICKIDCTVGPGITSAIIK